MNFLFRLLMIFAGLLSTGEVYRELDGLTARHLGAPFKGSFSPFLQIRVTAGIPPITKPNETAIVESQIEEDEEESFSRWQSTLNLCSFRVSAETRQSLQHRRSLSVFCSPRPDLIGSSILRC